jgi:hypothetical protein
VEAAAQEAGQVTGTKEASRRGGEQGKDLLRKRLSS